MFERILAAIDRDDPVGAALIMQRCAGLAAAHGSRLTMIHVRPALSRAYIEPMPDQWEQRQRSDAESWLNSLAREHGLSDRIDTITSPDGSISTNVIETASACEADAIVVAAHKMNIARMLLGSSTQAIVQGARCDVIVVRQKA
ncbi:MAG: universal stress protein [Erythrobacter sp.]